MTTTYGVTSTEVDFVLSSAGVARRTNDDETGVDDSTQVTSAIEMEAATINMYLGRRYVLSELTSNAWVKWTLAWFAAYRLDCRLANNPAPLLVKEREERLELLKLIADGQLDLPEQNPSYECLPSVTNLAAELRGGTKKIRVDPYSSTRPPSTEVVRNTTYDLYPQ